jgi:hypothetical protein
MRFYAIRRKSDGLFLPGGRARGFTHDMPAADRPPRLFTSKGGAKQALRCWLQGEWREVSSPRYSAIGCMDGFVDGDYDCTPEPPNTPPADRVAADMEVVPVNVVVRAERS